MDAAQAGDLTTRSWLWEHGLCPRKQAHFAVRWPPGRHGRSRRYLALGWIELDGATSRRSPVSSTGRRHGVRADTCALRRAWSPSRHVDLDGINVETNEASPKSWWA